MRIELKICVSLTKHIPLKVKAIYLTLIYEFVF